MFINNDTKPIQENDYGRVRSTLENTWLRGHNYVLKCRILRDNLLSHLPIIKTTGKGSKREYEYLKDVTVERTTRSVLFRLKKYYIRKITTPSDFVKARSEIINYLIDRATEFQQKYGIVLDLMTSTITTLEDELKDRTLNQIPRQFKFRADPHFKKLYDKGVEFTSEFSAINYLKNKVLEDQTPKIADLLELNFNQSKIFSDQLMLHLDAINKIGNEIGNLSKVVIDLKTKRIRKKSDGWIRWQKLLTQKQ